MAKQKWEEWQIPREADDKWPAAAKNAHAEWWKQRIARQKEIDASIAARRRERIPLRQAIRR